MKTEFYNVLHKNKNNVPSTFLKRFIFFTLVCNVNLVRFSESRSPDTTDRRCVAGHKEIGVTWKRTARCSFSGSTAIFKIDQDPHRTMLRDRT